MIPLTEPILPLWRIAEYWSREIGNVRGNDEIFDELLSSFWADNLYVTDPGGRNKVDRLAILKLASRCREHSGFVLIESPEDCPKLEKLPSGGVVIDIRQPVVLPFDNTNWTDTIIEAAYVKMSTTSIYDFDKLIQPAFRVLCTTREALRPYCIARGYPLPRFWFAHERDRGWNTRRETDAKIWFKQIVNGPKQKARKLYLADARRQFPDIPEDAFDRIWNELAPAEWKKPGPVVRGTKDTN